jgi:ketosteroid isomerase-like protein
MTTDENQITAAIEAFVKAYNAGDAAGVLRCYGDDLVKLRQGAAAETKPETAERIERTLRLSRGRLSVSNDEIVVSGDLAYARGTFRVTLAPRADGPEEVIERRFVEIWRRRAGRWLVTRTMDNTGAPRA